MPEFGLRFVTSMSRRTWTARFGGSSWYVAATVSRNGSVAAVRAEAGVTGTTHDATAARTAAISSARTGGMRHERRGRPGASKAVLPSLGIVAVSVSA